MENKKRWLNIYFTPEQKKYSQEAIKQLNKLETKNIEVMGKKFISNFQYILSTKIENLPLFQVDAEEESFNKLHETRDSQGIEGYVEDTLSKNVTFYKKLINTYEQARSFILVKAKIDSTILKELYKIISNDNTLSENQELYGKNGFRNGPIFIDDGSITLKEVSIEHNKIQSSLDNIFLYIEREWENVKNIKTSNKPFRQTFEYIKLLSWVHFFFEYIHPFPDFNGRIGRLILEHYIERMEYSPKNVRDWMYFSNSINITRKEYYNALEYTEQTHDLTYIESYFWVTFFRNFTYYMFKLENINEWNKLNDKQKVMLKVFFIYKDQEFTWKDYKTITRDKRSKKQIHNDLNVLEKAKLINSRQVKNRTKLFKIKTFKEKYEYK